MKRQMLWFLSYAVTRSRNSGDSKNIYSQSTEGFHFHFIYSSSSHTLSRGPATLTNGNHQQQNYATTKSVKCCGSSRALSRNSGDAN